MCRSTALSATLVRHLAFQEISALAYCGLQTSASSLPRLCLRPQRPACFSSVLLFVLLRLFRRSSVRFLFSAYFFWFCTTAYQTHVFSLPCLAANSHDDADRQQGGRLRGLQTERRQGVHGRGRQQHGSGTAACAFSNHLLDLPRTRIVKRTGNKQGKSSCHDLATFIRFNPTHEHAICACTCYTSDVLLHFAPVVDCRARAHRSRRA